MILFIDFALFKNASLSTFRGEHRKGFVTTDGKFSSGSTECHTDPNERNPWLRIELGEWISVKRIIVYNRSTSNLSWRNRLSNTYVYVFGESATQGRLLCYHITDGQHDMLDFFCSEPRLGKGLELSKVEIFQLHFFEF